MKAIRVHQFGPPEVMKLEHVPDPVPAAGQVRVRVRAVGVNPYEAYIRSGSYRVKPPLPYTPGKDAAGLVEAAGEGVANIRVGDRVYILESVTGAYAEMTLCDARHAYPLPDNVTFQQGAALTVPYATAYRALFDRAGARPGETVLVHGATGGVGLAAVQFAVAHGMTVIGTGGSEQGRKLVRDSGAKHVLDHKRGDYLDELMKLTNDRGVDIVLEMLANVNLDRDLGICAPGGRVVIIGSRGRIEIDPRQTMAKELNVLGMQLWAAGEQRVREAHAAIVAGLRNGTLRPVVGKELPLAEAPRAHHEIMEQPAYGKTVLIP